VRLVPIVPHFRGKGKRSRGGGEEKTGKQRMKKDGLRRLFYQLLQQQEQSAYCLL
jgi:hypothetical protein